MSMLFNPLTIGDLHLPNRIIMAPLTRCRSDQSRIPNDLMKKYYVQRASAGLIISEATIVSPMGAGYPNTPGIWSKEQVEGWLKITEAVHQAHGRIFLQLWHVGRVSDPSYLDGNLPLAPSAIPATGHVSLLRPKREYVTPRSISTNEINQIIEQFRIASQNALNAGFDGVEIHGANGYLLDQFLQDNSNTRKDEYGGSLENRARFMLEVTDAVISVWGSSRVGMHLAPRCDAHTMGDSNPLETFSYVANELKKRKIAFICAREAVKEDSIGHIIKKEFDGIYIANESFTQETAENHLKGNKADAIAFGKLFIANPDLPERFKRKTDLNTPDPETFYASGEEGYTTYPVLSI